MASALQTRSNLFGFEKRESATRTAKGEAYRAGVRAGDTREFEDWWKRSKFSKLRSGADKEKARQSFHAGAEYGDIKSRLPLIRQSAVEQGERDGNKEHFQDWLRHVSGSEFLESRDVASLRDSYIRGADRAKSQRERQEREKTREQEKRFKESKYAGDKRAADTAKDRGDNRAGEYRGYKLYKTAEGEYYSSLDVDSKYETSKDAKDAIADYLKGRQNPAPKNKSHAYLRGYEDGRAHVGFEPDDVELIRMANRRGLSSYDTSAQLDYIRGFQDAFRLRKRNPDADVTDRALRYRAQQTPPPGPKKCAFCGSSDQIMIGHVDGHEENGDTQNLIWTCRSCNAITANVLQRNGLGRRTHQYNPAAKGARSIGQWLTAIKSMRGDSTDMSVKDAVEMVQATPATRRSEFNAEIWAFRKKQQSNPSERNQSYALVQAADGAGEESGRGWTGTRKPTGAAIGKEFSSWIQYRKSSMPELATLTRGELLQLRGTFFRGFRQGYGGKRNPESGAERMFESFHGAPADRVTEIVDELHEHEWLATLGWLISMDVATKTIGEVEIFFPHPYVPPESGKKCEVCDLKEDDEIHKAEDERRPRLASNEDGTQLFIEGGTQGLTLEAIQMDKAPWLKEQMVIGILQMVTYQTKKKFDKFKLTDYYHKLGEETGEEPTLLYDSVNEKLSVAGGQYKIKVPLIGMSPGIEN